MSIQSESFQSRMGNIFNGGSFAPSSERTIIAALDDSLITGPGLPDESLLYYPDAVLRGVKGVASAALGFTGRFHNFTEDWPVDLARISNVTASVDGPHHLDKKSVLDHDMALKAAHDIGASAISFHLNHTSREEGEQMAALGRLGEACRQDGMPLLVHAYPRTEKRRWFSPWHETEYHYRELPGEHTGLKEYTRLVLHAADVAIDLGGNIIKLPYIDDAERLGQVVEFVHRNNAKVVIAGGPQTSIPKFLDKVRESRSAGADGHAIGRNFSLRRLGPPTDREHHGRRLLIAAAEIVHNNSGIARAIDKADLDTAA